jgi:hypothetical protein
MSNECAGSDTLVYLFSLALLACLALSLIRSSVCFGVVRTTEPGPGGAE